MAKNKLREARLSKGLSQEGLADLIGVTQCNYSRRENRKKAISDTEWTKIANALNVPKADIYENDSVNEKQNDFNNTPFLIMPPFISEYIELLQNENRFLKEKIKAFEL